MKRVICAVLAVMMIAVLFTGCKVKTSVDAKYADGFAENYATSKEVDDNGNVSYVFEGDKYDEFVADYYEEVKQESRLQIESSGQYSYYNPEITEIVVGITPEAWTDMGEEALRAEAQKVGEAALKFQMNTKKPKGELEVTYRNANTSEEYFTIVIEAE